MGGDMDKSSADDALAKAMKAMQEGKRLSSRQRRLIREAGEGAIDNFLRTVVGVSDPSEFTDDDGWRYLEFGSAKGVAFIDEAEDVFYLHCEGDVMPVPSDQELIVPLYRELLEMNLGIPGTCRFAIHGDHVVIVSTEELSVLRDDGDFARHIHGVMTCTDAVDSDLIRKYGTTTRKRPAGRKK
jgi:hypothetical protein